MTKRKRYVLLLAAVLLLPIAGVGITALVSPQTLMSLFVPPPPAPDPTAPPVKYSVKTTEIGVFLDHPVARKWLDKYFPGFRQTDQLALTRRLTLLEVQAYFPDLISDRALSQLKAELAATPPLEPIQVYSTDQTELGTLLDDPQAKAIVDKHLPGFTQDERLSMARPFTLKFLQTHIPDVVTEERCAAMNAEFAALAESRAEALFPEKEAGTASREEETTP